MHAATVKVLNVLLAFNSQTLLSPTRPRSGYLIFMASYISQRTRGGKWNFWSLSTFFARVWPNPPQQLFSNCWTQCYLTVWIHWLLQLVWQKNCGSTFNSFVPIASSASQLRQKFYTILSLDNKFMKFQFFDFWMWMLLLRAGVYQ